MFTVFKLIFCNINFSARNEANNDAMKFCKKNESLNLCLILSITAAFPSIYYNVNLCDIFDLYVQRIINFITVINFDFPAINSNNFAQRISQLSTLSI